MKFKEYVAGLVKLLADRPETGEFGVVTIDDGCYCRVADYLEVGSYDDSSGVFNEDIELYNVKVVFVR